MNEEKFFRKKGTVLILIRNIPLNLYYPLLRSPVASPFIEI